MQLSKLLNYGLRIVIYLAMAGGVCSSHEVAKAVDVPRDYLVQIAQLLKHANIIKAHPGKNGGYELARPSTDISLFEIIDALEKNNGSNGSGKQERIEVDTAPDLLKVLNAVDATESMHDEYLKGITIDAIMDGTQDIYGLDMQLEPLAN